MSNDAPVTPITVGLADDQNLVRAGFAMVLNSQPDIDVIWEASDGEEAVAMATQNPPDVVLMDVQMPVLDGIKATSQLLEAAPMAASGAPTRVVVLTTFDSQNYIVGAIEAGASGFLLKDTAPEKLIEDIRTVDSADAVISRETMATMIAGSEGGGNDNGNAHGTANANVAQAGATNVASASTASASAVEGANLGLIDPLTPRELEILELIARGKSNPEIAETLFISLPTVKTHVGRVLTKTGSRDRVHAVLFAFRRGLITQQQLLAE